jgi:hypothetical protein
MNNTKYNPLGLNGLNIWEGCKMQSAERTLMLRYGTFPNLFTYFNIYMCSY